MNYIHVIDSILNYAMHRIIFLCDITYKQNRQINVYLLPQQI